MTQQPTSFEQAMANAAHLLEQAAEARTVVESERLVSLARAWQAYAAEIRPTAPDGHLYQR